jgi:hypothetical protein
VLLFTTVLLPNKTDDVRKQLMIGVSHATTGRLR